MKLTVVGCSDAFGSGGRLQTCFHVATRNGAFLIDCGATSLTGIFKQDIDPNSISTIFITHLHGDHFGGLAWFLIHALHVAQRTAPLTLVGPSGLEERFHTVAEALFPGSTKGERRFELKFRSYRDFEPLEEGGVKVTPFVVSHPSGATPYALRFEGDGKVLTFSGDTEWVDTLVPAARGADLFICECFGFEPGGRYHLNWRTIEEHLPEIGAKKVLLTHLGPEALANNDMMRHATVSIAEDGLQLDV
jgi:ribonuclease BN (tRNA processing enzyme)